MQHYNHERFHEALGQRTPGYCYTSSSRRYPEKLLKLRYPSHIEAYVVDSCGVVNRGRLRIYAGYVLKREIVGLDNISEGVWDVILGPVVLGRFDEKDDTQSEFDLQFVALRSPNSPHQQFSSLRPPSTRGDSPA